MTSVVVGTPCYGGMVTVPFMESVLVAANRENPPYRLTLSTITNESLITRARNRIASEFLDSGADRLIFVDSDIRFSTEDLDSVALSDHDVIGGIVPVKKVDFDNAAKVENVTPFNLNVASLRYAVTPKTPENRRGDLVEVDYIGSAFLSMSRRAIESVVEANPDLSYTHEGRRMYAIFDTMVRDDIFLSEDYAFCQRWRDLGGTVWADYSVRLSHFGNYEFGIRY